MTDIVERLREKRGVLDNRWPGPTLMDEDAAREIERLRARVHEVVDARESYKEQMIRAHLALHDAKRDLTDKAIAWDEIAKKNAEIARLRLALESLTEDPPSTLDEPDEDWEVIVKMRAIARAALSPADRGSQ